MAPQLEVHEVFAASSASLHSFLLLNLPDPQFSHCRRQQGRLEAYLNIPGSHTPPSVPETSDNWQKAAWVSKIEYLVAWHKPSYVEAFHVSAKQI
jgi:hypothetical protein